MTVGELKKALEDIPDDRLVFCSRDAEGNGFSPLDEADDDNLCKPRNGWVDEIKSVDWTAYDAGLSESEWEDFKRTGTRVVVLWPTG